MEKRVAIIGAGVSGLVACKCAIEKGFHPTVFEAQSNIGGVWANTIESTKCQSVKEGYQYSDFPWPSHIKDMYPTCAQVIEYLEAYAQHFDLLRYVKFDSKVACLDYVGESNEEMLAWDRWGGTGKAFASNGKWHVNVEDTKSGKFEVCQFEFLILCIGRFSGIPNIPEFPEDHGPEVFNGIVMHSMEFSAMDNASAAELIKDKRVVIIGSQKSAVDIAVECANANGNKYPCTIIQRTIHWMLPTCLCFWGVHAALLYFTRFSELLVHKPGEPLLHSLLATLLSPMKWGIAKFTESYLKWKFPLKKYEMIPGTSIVEELSTCKLVVMSDDFYDKVKEGSIILKKSKGDNYFCKEGVIIDGEAKHVEADLVILATGYRGDQKLKNIFGSDTFRNFITEGSSRKTVPLYRQIVHPRIPQLAIIGYAESISNMPTAEMMSQWVAEFIGGNFELPSIREMQKDVGKWEEYMKEYGGKYFFRSCIAYINVWYNDQLCKDMGVRHKRKSNFLAEWFMPYGPMDYAGLTK